MEDNKEKFLQALGNLSQRRKEERGKSRLAPTRDLSRNLASGTLEQEIYKAKGSELGRDVTPERVLVPGGTSKIDTKQIAKTTDIGEFQKRAGDLDLRQKLKSSFKAAAEAGDENMMDQLRRVAKNVGKGASKGLKMLPIVGAAAGLIGADDASAAIPGLDAAEGVGMSAQDENQMLAETQGRMDYDRSQASADSQARRDKLNKLAQLKLAKQ